jgi:hypothetical protein
VVAARAGGDETVQLTGVVFQPFSEVRRVHFAREACSPATAPLCYHLTCCSLFWPQPASSSSHTAPPTTTTPPTRHTPQVKGELALVDKTNAQVQSFARVSFQDKCEAAINEQIK